MRKLSIEIHIKKNGRPLALSSRNQGCWSCEKSLIANSSSWVWLQTLRVMKDDQAIYDYLSRLLVIINRFKSNGASTLSRANLWVEFPIARSTFSYAIQQGFLHAVQSIYIWDVFLVKIAKYHVLAKFMVN